MKSRMPRDYNPGASNPMKQMQQMQEQIELSKQELEQKEFSTTAGGGMVEAVVNGKREVVRIKLKPEVVDPDDIEMLEDLIISAVNEGLRQVEQESESNMEKIAGGFSLPNIPGLF